LDIQITKKGQKMKIIKLILMLGISLFIVSCGGDSNESATTGWPESEKSKMLSECMASPESNKEMCDCAVGATVSEFTYDEYKMLQNTTEGTDIGQEMQERALNLMMSIMECAQ
tara:strand:+ start:388 stop:729 length:342 start_codon:yes stop_codon:yes gene_type:complete